MRTKLLSLDEVLEKEISMRSYCTGASGRRTDMDRLRRILSAAIHLELTERQCECIHMYYMKKMKAADIADLLEISPATVYKHIRQGMKSLKKCAAYL